MAEKPRTEFHNCKDQEEVDAFLNKVEPGDALEFGRTGLYRHWGICTGRNESGEIQVAHITAPKDTSKVQAVMAALGFGDVEPYTYCLENIGKPFQEELRYVMSTQSTVRVNNSIDDYVPSFAVDVILERVNQTLQDDGWECYHFALNNCEHYVNYCRNGNRVSLQSLRSGRQTLGVLATGARAVARTSPLTSFIATPAGVIFDVAAAFVANRERQFRGEVEIENNNG